MKIKEFLKWDIYEITAQQSLLIKVKLCGRIRKLCLKNGINVLVENAVDAENTVRFTILEGESVEKIKKYLISIIPDSKVELIKSSVINPALSKMKRNIIERYIL